MFCYDTWKCTVGFVALFIWPLRFVRQKQVSKSNCVAYIGDINETKKVVATLITVQSFQKLVDIAEDPSNKILCHNNIAVILTSFKHYNS